MNDGGYDGGAITLSSYGGVDLALTESTVFFTNEEVGVLSVPRNGGPTTILYQKTSAFEFPTNIAVDNNAVYWTDYNFGRVLKIDQTTQVVSILATPYQPLGLRLRAGMLYWTSSVGIVGTISVDGLNEGTYNVGSGTVPTELAVDDTAIYVVDLEGPIGNEKIIRVDLDSGVATVLADSQENPGLIEVDDSFVYWGVGNDSGGVLCSIPKDGGTVAVLASASLAVGAIGLDAGAIYFTTLAQSESTILDEGLFILDRQTNVTTKLVQDLVSPIALWVGSDGIYWTEQDSRVAKLPYAFSH